VKVRISRPARTKNSLAGSARECVRRGLACRTPSQNSLAGSGLKLPQLSSFQLPTAWLLCPAPSVRALRAPIRSGRFAPGSIEIKSVLGACAACPLRWRVRAPPRRSRFQKSQCAPSKLGTALALSKSRYASPLRQQRCRPRSRNPAFGRREYPVSFSLLCLALLRAALQTLATCETLATFATLVLPDLGAAADNFRYSRTLTLGGCESCESCESCEATRVPKVAANNFRNSRSPATLATLANSRKLSAHGNFHNSRSPATLATFTTLVNSRLTGTFTTLIAPQLSQLSQLWNRTLGIVIIYELSQLSHRG